MLRVRLKDTGDVGVVFESLARPASRVAGSPYLASQNIGYVRYGQRPAEYLPRNGVLDESGVPGVGLYLKTQV